MAAGIPAVPASFKPLQHHIKTAAEHDARDPVVAYYCKPFQRVVVKLDDLTVGGSNFEGWGSFLSSSLGLCRRANPKACWLADNWFMIGQQCGHIFGMGIGRNYIVVVVTRVVNRLSIYC